MEPNSLSVLIIFSSFLFVYTLEFVTGRIPASPRPGRDALFTLVGLLSQGVLAGAVVGTLAGFTARHFLPGGAGALSGVSFLAAFLLIFFLQEFMHYWLHRYAHEWRWLWKVHRTHHSAQQLNAGVLYRYNVFWVLMLPQTWVGAFATYYGQHDAYVLAVMLTYFNNLLTHTNYRWDLWLREKTPWAAPLWRVIERTITLPDAHHAHHAYGKTAHPNGNYAVTLFLFDRMFGTAKIPNSRQDMYGLPISSRLHWAEELFWPVIRRPLLPKKAAR